MRRSAKLALAAIGAVALFVVVQGARTYRRVLLDLAPPREVHAPPSALVATGRFSEITFETRSKLAIKGWRVASNNGAAVIFVHGSPGSRADMLPEALALVGAGYGATLFDLPGHGESEGRPDWGASFVEALSAAIDDTARRADVDPTKIGVFGFSMGASTAIELAASDRRVRALVVAGAFTDEREQTRFEFRRWGPITEWPAVWACERAIALDHLEARRFVASVAPTPMLFVIGTGDEVVPPSMQRELFDLAREPKEAFIVDGAAHGGYAAKIGDAYFAKLRAFFDATLRPR